VVNATGVWSDGLMALDAGDHAPAMRPAKGIHLTVPWEKVRNDIALVIPVPKDKRSLFVVPWLPRPDGTFELTYVGTTDTDYQGPLDDPVCTSEDVAYVLRALNASIPTGITENDVVATWAGLRPLIRSASSSRTADLSRRHMVKASPSGLITVAGGKLTTFRRMASDGVDAVMAQLGRSGRSRSARTPLVGAAGYRAPGPDAGARAIHLASRYGTEAADVEALIAGDPRLGEPLVTGLPYVAAEAIFAVRNEMAASLADVLDRRTRARLQARDDTAAAAEHVARLIAPELGWDEARIVDEVARYRAEITAERDGAGLPEAHLAPRGA
jgi:glycerol-3-phosphate dehydrogenase